MKRLWPDSFVEEANLNVHVSALRKAFGESAHSPRYINTIPGRGYRFRAELGEGSGVEAPAEVVVRERVTARVVLTEEVGDDSVAAEGEAVVRAGAGAHGANVGRRPRRPAILLACAAALLTGVALLVYFGRAPGGDKPDGAGAPVRSLAVLPFKSLGGGDEHLGVGVADTLITRLGGLSAVTVRPTSAVLGYADAARDPVEVGRELGVDSVLEGSIQREGERVRVTVRLIGVRDRRVLWGGQFDEQFKGILDVQDTISRKVAESLAPELSEGQRESVGKRHTNSAEAYRVLPQGASLLEQEVGRRAEARRGVLPPRD